MGSLFGHGLIVAPDGTHADRMTGTSISIGRHRVQRWRTEYRAGLARFAPATAPTIECAIEGAAADRPARGATIP
jgi:hypothetical protein